MADIGAKYGHEPGRNSNVQLKAITWAASKLAPKHYGDKLNLNHGGQDGENPVKVERVLFLADEASSGPSA